MLVIMGQFFQTLCVLPGATEGEVQRTCLFSHPELWPLVCRYTFTRNMRADANSPDVVSWNNWLGDVSQGTAPLRSPDPLPGQIDIPVECRSINLDTGDIIGEVFGNFEEDDKRGILAPLNYHTDNMNERILSTRPGPVRLYTA